MVRRGRRDNALQRELRRLLNTEDISLAAAAARLPVGRCTLSPAALPHRPRPASTQTTAAVPTGCQPGGTDKVFSHLTRDIRYTFCCQHKRETNFRKKPNDDPKGEQADPVPGHLRPAAAAPVVYQPGTVLEGKDGDVWKKCKVVKRVWNKKTEANEFMVEWADGSGEDVVEYKELRDPPVDVDEESSEVGEKDPMEEFPTGTRIFFDGSLGMVDKVGGSPGEMWVRVTLGDDRGTRIIHSAELLRKVYCDSCKKLTPKDTHEPDCPNKRPPLSQAGQKRTGTSTPSPAAKRKGPKPVAKKAKGKQSAKGAKKSEGEEESEE